MRAVFCRRKSRSRVQAKYSVLPRRKSGFVIGCRVSIAVMTDLMSMLEPAA